MKNPPSSVPPSSDSRGGRLSSSRSLPIRERSMQRTSPDEATLGIHPLDNGFLVSVRPPPVPSYDNPSYQGHTPVDLVLVIDVSGSMQDSAVMPSVDGAREHTGLSILDLTKHAARTIIETLNEGDRLGIVTFGYDAEVVQGLTPMTRKHKNETLKRVENLRPNGATNLWHGLLRGRELFLQAGSGRTIAERSKTQAMYILTDGMPNHMCPQQGYVRKLKSIMEKEKETDEGTVLPSIHTFGFGYSLRSGLLQSIAEIGGGSYAFIPDAGMIGTIFVHAMANLYSTFAKAAGLRINVPSEVALEDASSNPVAEGLSDGLMVPLGNLQYGQSRDIVVMTKLPPHYRNSWSATAYLSYDFGGETKTASANLETEWEFSERSAEMSPEIAQYHICRAKMCRFLNSLFPTKADGEHIAKYEPKILTPQSDEPGELSKMEQLGGLVAWIQSSPASDSELVQSLLQDLNGTEPQGQVRIALEDRQEFRRWGQHYLPSLLHAHLRQACNSFKDAGPLQYGTASPVFQRCRQQLDDAFDKLPPPKPSIKPRQGQTHRAVSTMHSYNRVEAPCFARGMLVRLSDDSESACEKVRSVPVEDLRPGMKVWTPRGSRKVRALVETAADHGSGSSKSTKGSLEVHRVGDLLVTAWHPVLVGGKWTFPADLTGSGAGEVARQDVDAVYSVLLEENSDIEAHAIEIGGTVAVTLGHGMLKSESGDIRAHPFFGNHAKVSERINKLTTARSGVMTCLGMEKSMRTGLAKGFRGLHKDREWFQLGGKKFGSYNPGSGGTFSTGAI